MRGTKTNNRYMHAAVCHNCGNTNMAPTEEEARRKWEACQDRHMAARKAKKRR